MREVIKISKLRGDDGYKTISIRMREKMLADIDALAQETNRSRNELINFLLQEALKLVEIEE